MNNLLRQPLLHFFTLGAALFVLFAVVNDDAGTAPDEIVVDANRVAALVTRFERTWQRPPAPAELDGLIDSWVREEMLYREGLALGFDRDDPIVRRRLAQKVEFMIDGVVQPPDEAELTDWLQAHADDYRVPAKFAFEQVFFNTDTRGDEISAVVQEALASLQAGAAPEAGDPTLLPGRVDLASALEIGRTFGADFAAGLGEQPVGEWTGPVKSAYGLHLVRIEQKEPAYLPPLDEVRDAVERDVMQARAEQVKEAFFEALRERYEVRIEAEPSVAGANAAD